MTSLRWTVSGLSVTLLAAAPGAAQVGEGLIVQPEIAQAYDRSRNVAVEEQPRPEYTPNGVRFSSFRLYPRVEVGGGGTSNTYLTDTDAVASATAYVRPTARLVSDWSRHQVEIRGQATFRNYLGESRRDERVWNLGAEGRLDIRRSLTAQAEVNISQAFENLFSGEVVSTVAALSRYRRDFASLQTTYTSGRGRAFVVADYTDLRFRPIPLASGGVRDQSDRDRSVTRLTGQVEYARSSTVSVFGQVSGSRTRFDQELLTGGPNLDSKALRALAGVNIDVNGRARGTIGVGYSVRDYDAAIFDTVRGVSVESRMQLFPLRRLTVTLTGQRTIEDAAVNNRSRYWNTRFTARTDYELLRNLILNATAEYSHQDYLESDLVSDIYRVGTGARYMVSRRVQIQGGLSYSHRSSSNAQALGTISEARGEVGIAYQL